jgi:hypothetical protein
LVADPLLPNLFLVGAAKCGTTSLHHYLGAHPEVEMTSVKEPQLFAGDEYRSQLASYASLFARSAPVRGESSAVYSQYPSWPGIPERISEHVPDARILYLVRDPIDRALAHYRQHVRDHKEGRTVGEAFAGFADPAHTYIAPSRYATQLDRYLARFDPDRVLVVDRDRLLADRDLTLGRIFAFLGVDPSFRSEAFEARLNTSRHLRRPTALGRALRRSGAMPLLRRAPLPGRLRERLRGGVSRPIEAAGLPGPLRDAIAESLAGEVERLRVHTGESFDGWDL